MRAAPATTRSPRWWLAAASWMWTGCQQADTDADLYLRALTAPTITLADRLALCRRLGDADLRGECAAGVVSTSLLSPEEQCEQIPAGRWQDECWFGVAERRGPWLSPQEAATACQRAGIFVNPCVGHLLSRHVQQLHATGATLDQVSQLADAWVAGLGKTSAETDCWRFYWELEFKKAPDPHRCASAHQPRPCAEALVSTFRVQLRHHMQADPATWCRGAVVEPVLQQWVSQPDDALRRMLDQEAQRVHDAECR